MAKTDAKRDDILDRLADHVLAEGLAASSLRPLAAAARTSDRMLLYYFDDKAALVAATLERVFRRLAVKLGGAGAQSPRPFEALQAELFDAATNDDLWPYTRLWLELASLAARGDPLFREIGGRIARAYLQWIAAQLACDDDSRRERETSRLLIGLEGMLLLHGVGLTDVCRSVLASRATSPIPAPAPRRSPRTATTRRPG